MTKVDAVVSEDTGKTRSQLALPAMFLANLTMYLPQLVTSLLLIEIADSFSTTVGIASQIRSLAAAVSVIVCIVIGALSVRVTPKTLLLVGLTALGLSAVGSSLAPTFTLLLGMYAVYGVAMATIMPMSNTLIGRLYTVNERPKIASYLIAAIASAYLVGSPIVGYLNDWRLAFLFFVAPFTCVSFLLALIGLPTSAITPGKHITSAFRHVLTDTSAVACIIANTLSTTAYTVIGTFAIPFYRQHFAVDTAFLSLFLTLMASIYITGSLIGGRLVKKLGRKPLTAIFAAFYGICIMLLVNVSNVWLSFALTYLGIFGAGIRYAAYNSLALEQAPAFRGTMMSLSQLSSFLAQTLGISIGGYLLLSFDYGILGLVLGPLAMLAAIIFYYFAKDPTRVR